MATPLSLAPLFRQSVGFDRFNDLFESALRSETPNTYPPHNVEKHGDDEYRIVIAVAGLTEADLDIQVEKGVLTVVGDKRETEKEVTYLHQGIAQRAFRLSFRLADHIEVRGASMNNGLLSIDLLRVVPEEAKPKKIAIGSEGTSELRQVSLQ
jgi:molecular chaperone IbpA